MLKNNRNTLEFLEETQKYIRKICNPNTKKQVEIFPSSCKPKKSFKNLMIIKSEGNFSGRKKINLTNKRFKSHNRFFIKNILRDSKSEIQRNNSPVSRITPNYENDFVLKSTRILMKKS